MAASAPRRQPRNRPCPGGSHTGGSREAEARARGNAGVVQGGAREERGRPGHQHRPGGRGTPSRSPRARPAARTPRLSPALPGRGETEARHDQRDTGGSGTNPRGTARPRPPPGSHPDHPRTGQTRARRSPDPGSSLQAGPLRWGGATPVPVSPRCPGQGSCQRGRQGPAALRAHLPCAPRRGRRPDRGRGRIGVGGLGPGPSAPPPAPAPGPPPGNSQPDGQAAQPMGARQGL